MCIRDRGPSVNFINNLSLAAISVFGGLLFIGGGLSIGSLTSFVLYSRKFSGPIREAANPVSYTHLDVYKRQGGSNTAGAWRSPGRPPCWRRC